MKCVLLEAFDKLFRDKPDKVMVESGKPTFHSSPFANLTLQVVRGSINGSYVCL